MGTSSSSSFLVLYEYMFLPVLFGAGSLGAVSIKNYLPVPFGGLQTFRDPENSRGTCPELFQKGRENHFSGGKLTVAKSVAVHRVKQVYLLGVDTNGCMIVVVRPPS